MSEALAHANGEGVTDASSDGPLDGHEPVRLPQVGTGATPDQRACGDAAAADPEGAGGSETRASLLTL